MLPHIALGIVMVLASVASAVVALWIVSRLTDRSRPDRAGAANEEATRNVLLFDDHDLVDATPAGFALLETASDGNTDLDRVIATLGAQFDGLREAIGSASLTDDVVLQSIGSPQMRLAASRRGRILRIEIGTPALGPDSDDEALSVRLLLSETNLLREVAASSPILIWKYDSGGAVDWANRTYLDHAAIHLGVAVTDLTWPLADFMTREAAPLPNELRRQRVEHPHGGRSNWYERRVVQTTQGELHFAAPAEQIVKAEMALREFVQTLTKTFAHLPIGLAIFDRSRQLALFNPALIDLTTLGPEFLSSRPTLLSFFDALREARMIPEPKDYHSWRQTMTDLEKAAARGLYEETWSLASGQTYHVSGRPHPDGAVAFLIEDISAEVSLTRRFRSEIDLGHEVIDRMSDAVAVFSPAGRLELSNRAYARLWGADPGSALSSITASDAIAHWRERSRDDDAFAEAIALFRSDADGGEVESLIRLRDGRPVHCRFATLSGGTRMASFRPGDLEILPTRRMRQRIGRGDLSAVKAD